MLYEYEPSSEHMRFALVSFPERPADRQNRASAMGTPNAPLARCISVYTIESHSWRRSSQNCSSGMIPAASSSSRWASSPTAAGSVKAGCTLFDSNHGQRDVNQLLCGTVEPVILPPCRAADQHAGCCRDEGLQIPIPGTPRKVQISPAVLWVQLEVDCDS